MHAYICCVAMCILLDYYTVNTLIHIQQLYRCKYITYIDTHLGLKKIYVHFIEVYLCCVCSFRHGLTQGMKIEKKYISGFPKQHRRKPNTGVGKEEIFLNIYQPLFSFLDFFLLCEAYISLLVCTAF